MSVAGGIATALSIWELAKPIVGLVVRRVERDEGEAPGPTKHQHARDVLAAVLPLLAKMDLENELDDFEGLLDAIIKRGVDEMNRDPQGPARGTALKAALSQVRAARDAAEAAGETRWVGVTLPRRVADALIEELS